MRKLNQLYKNTLENFRLFSFKFALKYVTFDKLPKLLHKIENINNYKINQKIVRRIRCQPG